MPARKISVSKYSRIKKGKLENVKNHKRTIQSSNVHKSDIKKIKKGSVLNIILGKSSGEQRQKKIEGNEAENLVAKELESKLPKEYSVSINRNEGIDLYLTNGQILNVEVKSARKKVREGKETRTGRFWLKEGDYLHSDFFGFVIKEVDDNLNWTGKSKIRYVKTKDVQKYLKKNKRFRIADSVKITITDVKGMPKLNIDKYFKEVLEGKEPKKSFF